ncbi:prepilin-type N-terminal cleavage/methylation domain-containing protein [Aminivibrio sp.]|uniref:prepilin-type N-terminal cleavage/methylation domain-containing protein n=1 Tax=Aminivibrio sp. TaxID=1872489 RepID=UPI001A5F6D15|nr:prepilin-type N-terminal cleavage/methylation domain-containing protein [Aminivibrio sp.]MBL3540668.1 prepilin-type N-terminal cleavage/methylation domain-containing protein [Aminivibrio sp.]
MKKVLKKRTGFTLVELLIVIIIIGILAGAMLLVAGSGTDKAEATKIVSDLRSLKAAALMYYADNPNNTTLDGNQIAKLTKYMDRGIETDDYTFLNGTVSADNTAWFVGRLNITRAGVQEKLAETAESVGLLAEPQIASDTIQSGDLYETTDTPTTAYMRAR